MKVIIHFKERLLLHGSGNAKCTENTNNQIYSACVGIVGAFISYVYVNILYYVTTNNLIYKFKSEKDDHNLCDCDVNQPFGLIEDSTKGNEMFDGHLFELVLKCLLKKNYFNFLFHIISYSVLRSNMV